MPKKSDKELHLEDDLDSMTHEEQTKLMLLSMRKFGNEMRDIGHDNSTSHNDIRYGLIAVLVVVAVVGIILIWLVGNLPQNVCSTESETMYVDMSTESMMHVNIPVDEGYTLTDINCFGKVSYIVEDRGIFIHQENVWNGGLPFCEKNKCGCVVTISKEVCEVR